MKEKLLITLTTLIIFVALGVVFSYGQKVITKESVSGYSMYSFVDPSKRFFSEEEDKIDIFGFEIQNLETIKKDYQVMFFVDNQEYSKLEISIPAGSTRQIIPLDEFYRNLESLNKNTAFEYSIKIKKEDSSGTLTKKVIKE